MFLFDWIFLSMPLQEIIKEAGIFVALFSAEIALAVADREEKKIKLEIRDLKIKRTFVDQEVYALRDQLESMSEIPENEIKSRYKKFTQPIKFYKVEFKIINKSKFSWENPTFTYEFPISQRYLVDQGAGRWKEDLPHTNYHAYGASKMHWFVSGDKDIFSTRKLPYINNKGDLDVWFTMFLDSDMERFFIRLSINCKNAEGFTKEIPINPKKLIQDYDKDLNKRKD